MYSSDTKKYKEFSFLGEKKGRGEKIGRTSSEKEK
jgi:hypothetical protein